MKLVLYASAALRSSVVIRSITDARFVSSEPSAYLLRNTIVSVHSRKYQTQPKLTITTVDNFGMQTTTPPNLDAQATTESLRTRVFALEAQLKAQKEAFESLRLIHSRSHLPPAISTNDSSPLKKKDKKIFDPSQHTTRYIALKFSYLGHRYNGLEHANRCFTPLPTVEEVVWKALRKAKLISPDVPEHADQSEDVIFNQWQRENEYFVYGKSRPEEEACRGGRRKRLEISWEGCDYSKCGRTDRGVSAFGQVIGIRVRSNKPVQLAEPDLLRENRVETDPYISAPEEDMAIDDEDIVMHTEIQPRSKAWHHLHDELPYLTILNSILPPDIRMLAWCPSPPSGWDARYSCLERQYKYFFTNPSFLPTPGPFGSSTTHSLRPREGWLDINKMRIAAKKLQGHHDYRNLCQLDASKQMPNCERRINFADIEEFDGHPSEFGNHPHLGQYAETLVNGMTNGHFAQPTSDPKVYTFTVHGTAFLWHQVRCMAAILFLVGQGLEEPEVVDQLLDIKSCPGRPHYAMADDAPLVLYNCVYPKEILFNGEISREGQDDALRWIYAGDEGGLSSLIGKGDGKFGAAGVIDELWAQWQEAKLRETQLGGLLKLVLSQGDETSLLRGGHSDTAGPKRRSQKVFEGASKSRAVGQYVPLMSRRKMDSLEMLNAKYAASVKGRRRDAGRNSIMNSRSDSGVANEG